MGRWSADERRINEATIVALYQESPEITYTEIEERTGIPRQTVREVFKRLGLQQSTKRNSRGTRFKLCSEDEKTLVQMYVLGEPPRSLSERFGVSYTAVYDILNRHGAVSHEARRGSDHPCWKGGRHTNEDGYVEVWMDNDHPLVAMRKRDGYVAEHRLVMAQALERPLTHRETVHHVNSDRSDNRLENLQLRTGNHGSGIVLRCQDCGSQNVVEATLE